MKIGKTSIIKENVKIGKNVEIGEYVEIENAIIGDGARIKSGVKIGGEPEDRAFTGEMGKVIIGENTIIFEYATIHSATGDDMTIIGKNCMIMAYVHIAHNSKLGDNVVVVNGTQVAGYVEIEDNGFIGGVSGIHQYTKIGENAFLGAYSYLTRDLPPFFSAAGIPAEIKGINRVGMERNGYTKEEIKFMREVLYKYHIEMVSLKEFVKFLEERKDDFPRITLPLLKFIDNSKRGLLR